LAQDLQTAVLTVPLKGEEFIIETDASERAVGAILSVCREGRRVPVEFASKKLSPPQRNWPVREREALAIVWAVHRFDGYVRGRAFTVYTDHESLKFLFQATDGKLARWAARLAEYDITIQYQKGKEHQHVDTLSRYVEPPEAEFPDKAFCFNIQTALPSIEEVLSEQRKRLPPLGRGYIYREGITYYRNGIWVPEPLRHRILDGCHICFPDWHCGARKTKTRILQVWNWPNLHQDVCRYIKSCLICQRTRPGLERFQGLFLPQPAGQIFEKVHMDIWGPCGFGGQDHLLLTMLDPCTRWAECALLPDKSAETIARTFVHFWISRWGFPRLLITDQDPSFCNQIIDQLCLVFNMRHLRTTPYHPEGNSPVESFHRVLRKGLSQFQFFRRGAITMSEALDLVLLGYRSTPHLSTGNSPAFLVYGADPPPPVQSDWRYHKSVADQDRVRFLMWLRVEIALKAKLRAESLRERYEADAKRTDDKFELGDLILVPLTIRESRQLTVISGGAKLIPQWSTPARVIRVFGHGKSAIVRNLLTQQTRQVHIQHARFIDLPLTEEQQRQWEEVLYKTLELFPTAFDADDQTEIIKNHFVPFGKRKQTDMALEGDDQVVERRKAPRSA
jgi:transposase InsO family protein